MQETITILLVGAAFGYGIFSLLRVIFPKKKDNHHGCSSNCSCDAVKLRKELLANKKSNV
jgi:hypothetical protein